MFAIFKKHSTEAANGDRYPTLRKAGVAYGSREEAEAALAADPRESSETHEVCACTEEVPDIYDDAFFYEVL